MKPAARPLRIGVQPDRHKDESFSNYWVLSLRQHGAEVVLLDLLGKDPLAQAAACDGIMWRWIHNPTEKQVARPLLHLIENYLGKPVFPNQRTSWFYDEKVWETQLLKQLGAPQPEYWLFWRENEALEWAETAPYPLVFKLSVGAGSSNVIKVNTPTQARRLIRRAFRFAFFPYTLPGGISEPRKWWQRIRSALWRAQHLPAYSLAGQYPPLPPVYWMPERAYVYFQRFLPGNDFDTRITVIGDHIFASRRFNRPGDFRASGGGQIDYDPDPINRRCLEIARDTSCKGGFQCMAYDFLMDDGRPVISEMSCAFPHDVGSYSKGHWRPDLSYSLGLLEGKEAQVRTFLAEVATHPSVSL